MGFFSLFSSNNNNNTHHQHGGATKHGMKNADMTMMMPHVISPHGVKMHHKSATKKRSSLSKKIIKDLGSEIQKRRKVSKQHRSSSLKITETDTSFSGAGKRAGLMIWQTSRTGVRRCKDELGKFHSDSVYIVLNTFKVDDKELVCDMHLWIGSKATNDKICSAKLKALELKDVIEDKLQQEKVEQEQSESRLFQSYFKELIYVSTPGSEGLRDSRRSELTELNLSPKLFHVQNTGRTTQVVQIDCNASQMRHDGVYLCDLGNKLIVYFGKDSNAINRFKATMLQNQILSTRHGKAIKGDASEFFDYLKGSESDIPRKL